MCLDGQMADPDSPAEVSQRGQELVVPPAGGSEPGLNGCAPSLRTELQAGGQEVRDGPGGEEEEDEEGGADGAFTKPGPPLLQLRRGTDNTLIHKVSLQSKCVLKLMILNTEADAVTSTDHQLLLLLTCCFTVKATCDD